ncbi:sigma 54-interacting transcriptional regulator [Peribacillus sp. NPDC097675]|uniref:sigma 54-interacting transcriptional regulator n=1 Tax=Peribacillus sp. NPDC097675 TaxID=3390618 RepID=UPI003CFD3C04
MQIKIAIVGFPPFSKLAKEVLIDLPPWVTYEITELPLKFLSSPESIRELESFFDPATIVVSGNRSSLSLKQNLNNLVIPVKMTGFDLLELIQKVGKEEVVIMNYGEDIKALDNISSLLNIKVRQIQFNDIQEAYTILEHLRDEGVKDVIGGSWVCEAANQLGMNGVFYYSKRAVENTLQDALNVVKVYRSKLEGVNLFKTMMNISRNGLISTDSDFNVISINESTKRLLGIKGRQTHDINLNKLIPNLMPNQASEEWNEPQYNLIFEHDSKKLMADIIPVSFQGDSMGHLISIEDVVKLKEKELKIRKNINQKPMMAGYSFADIIGSSPSIKETIQQAKKYSRANPSILIHGESGTGKELFSQSIHQYSYRSIHPFITVNCAALPESLIDSELFGYEEGAFTGAKKGGKVGLFEMAHQGTIFLDEISELPLHLQSRLLRVLQEKEIVRIGGDQVIPIDVRIISASNKNLLDCVKKGTFRDDLYFRISVLQLYIPPLRHRPGDILHLFRHFIQKNERILHVLSKVNMNPLTTYHWPGNVRELQNVAERFLVLCDCEDLTSEFLESTLHMALYHPHSVLSNKDNKKPHGFFAEELERIKIALEKAEGNKEKAAELLGISRTTLWRKLKNVK